MNFLLFINTPDSTEEVEEDHTSIESMQARKDSIMGMPWVSGEPDIYASDMDGNEVHLK